MDKQVLFIRITKGVLFNGSIINEQSLFAIGVDAEIGFLYCLANLKRQTQFQFSLKKNTNQTISVEFVKHICGHYFPVCKIS